MGQSNLQAIDYTTLNANSMASAKKSLWAGVRSGSTPVFAIYAGENAAILDSPNDNLDEIFFHTNYDYLRVKGVLDFTINFPARAKRENTSAGKKHATNIVSYNGYADSWIADLPASVRPASVTVPPAMFTVFVKNNSSSGSMPLMTARAAIDAVNPSWTWNYNSSYVSSSYNAVTGKQTFTKYTEDLIQYQGYDKWSGYYFYTIPGHYDIRWHGSVYSSQGYYNNTYVAGSPAHATARAMLGISTSPTANDSYTGINYAWYFNGGTTLDVYESGVHAQRFTLTYSTSDVFSITHDGSYVRYYRNNTLMRTVPVGNATFYLDTSFYDIGAALSGLKIGQLSGLTAKKNLDGTSFGGTIPVQVVNPNNFRLATIYNDGEHLVVRERYQCFGQDLPAISIQCRAYFYGQTQGVLAYSGLYAVHSPASFNDNTPYNGAYWRRVYTTINFSTSNSGEYFNKVEIQRTAGAKPVSSVPNWNNGNNRATNYHYIDQINGSAITATDPYNNTWYTAYSGSSTQSFSMRVFTEHPYLGTTVSSYYSPRWIVRFTNTTTGQTFDDVIGGIHWFRKSGA